VKTVNARVVEVGLPRMAYYMATHVSGTKHYMEIRYGQRQSRKWVPIDKVTLHEGVELRYVEKVTEL
jgi:hypothetical protein